MSVDYIKSAGAADNPLVVDYVWSSISSSSITFTFNLITLLLVKSFNNTNKFELTFINLYSNVSLSQFIISDLRVNKTDIKEENGQVVLTVDCDPSLKTDFYEIEIDFVDTNVTVLITEIRTINRFIKISSVRFQNGLEIYLLNP